MMHRTASQDHEAGFTLLELLIATTLLGLLMVILFGGLRLGTRAWERVETDSAAADDVRLAQTWLRHELSLAYPFYLSNDLMHPRVDFAGSANEMTFLAPIAAATNLAGRARITMHAVAQDGGLALLVVERHELSTSSAAVVSQEALLNRLGSLQFSYFGSDGPDAPPRWRDRWVDSKTLPQLIRISATFLPNDDRKWPEFVVSPQLSEDVGCFHDLLTNSCRGR